MKTKDTCVWKSFFFGLFLLPILCVDFSFASLALKVDTKNYARVAYNDIVVIPSLGGKVEYFNRDLFGSRDRIFNGLWSGIIVGSLYAENNGKYVLSGKNGRVNAECTITYEQVDADTIDLTIQLKTPAETGHFTYEILKLHGDLFKGATMAAVPSKRGEHGSLPVEALGFEDRFLLKNKRSVSIKGDFWDIEIIDQSGASSISAADFRNVPWDVHKSFYFYATANNLKPLSNHTYQYRIRISSAAADSQVKQMHAEPDTVEIKGPQQADISHARQRSADAGAGGSTAPVNNPVEYTPYENVPVMEAIHPFFNIPCKEESVTGQLFSLEENAVVYGDKDSPAVNWLVGKLNEISGIQPQLKVLSGALPDKGIIIGPAETVSAQAQDLPAEGFEIDLGKKRVIIAGVDARGVLYGTYKLLSLFNYDQKGWSAECGHYRDWPDIKTRGMLIELYPPKEKNIKKIDFFKRYIEALSMARTNTIVFLLQPYHLTGLQYENAYWSKSELQDIVSYAKKMHMDVWAGMKTKFDHNMPKLEIANGSNYFNPLTESNYTIIWDLIEQLIDVFDPTALLISHDEIKGLSIYAVEQGVTAADVFAATINKITKWIAGKGVNPLIFGDMLLDHAYDAKYGGAANSENPIYNSGDTSLALKKISKDLTILDWHYKEVSDYPSIGEFVSQQFETVGVTWHDPVAAVKMGKSVKKYNAKGILGSDWGFFFTNSPTALTLYAPVSGWNLNSSPTGSDEDVFALYSVVNERKINLYSLQTPYPIESFVNETMLDSTIGDGQGLFDLGSYADLRHLKSGRDLYNGMIYTILPNDNDVQKNCIVVGYDSQEREVPTQSKKIELNNQVADGIAFLHTCALEIPRYNPRLIGRYTIEYSDGDKDEVDIIENYNITDMRSSTSLRQNWWSFRRRPDLIFGSSLAWNGQSDLSIPLNLQSYIWENPKPGKGIKSVTISANSIGMKSQLALIALTLLKK